MASRALLIYFLISAISQETVLGETLWGYTIRVGPIYEVGNQLALKDFELNQKSPEEIRDKDGLGWTLGWGLSEHFELEVGQTHTLYQGKIEDSSLIEFSTTQGNLETGNVIYQFDLGFNNQFIGFNFLVPNATIGAGRLIQSPYGKLTLKTKDQQDFAEIIFESSRPQFYYQTGFVASIDLISITMLVRSYDASVLKLKSCHRDIVGNDTCDTLQRVTGNKSQRTTVFQTALISIGFAF